MDKKASIVIPVYRAEHTVERCVRSVLEGTYGNVELLLIEDRGGDRSLEICNRLAQADARVRVFANGENRGVSHTRNVGLAKATGEYLMFLDSDDWVEPDFVRSMVEAMAPGVLPVCGYYNHDEVKNGRMDVYGWAGGEAAKAVPLSQGLLQMRQGRLLQMIWNKAFRLDAVRSHGLRFQEDLSCGEDFRFLLDYLQAGKIQCICCLPEVLYHYSRDNGDSLATRFTRIAPEELLQDLCRMYELAGMRGEQLEQTVNGERQAQLSHYAYCYMHDEALTGRQKKQKILELPLPDPMKVYRAQRLLYWKETIKKVLIR